MKLKLTVLLTTCVVAMGLLLSASMAQAEPEVIWEGNNATGIKNLEVDTILYNVEFLFDNAETIYGEDLIFDFPNEPRAAGAVNAIGEALTDVGPEAIQTVGPTTSPSTLFVVGFAKANVFLVEGKRGLYLDPWWGTEQGTELMWPTNEFVYADFTPVDGPPADAIPIPRTGQIESYGDRDDGDLQKGAPWPDPRFTDNGDGTVTDHLTGLIWLQRDGCAITTWEGALEWVSKLAEGEGLCGLTDGSQPGDWRMPNRREQESLIDISQHNPALPIGHPFILECSAGEWTSSSYPGYNAQAAWVVWIFGTGQSVLRDKDLCCSCTWPVRDGN